MVRESSVFINRTETGVATHRPEFSGAITSREETIPASTPTGRVKCVCSITSDEVELIHYTNHERSLSMCGLRVAEYRLFMGNVKWGADGFLWCPKCEESILAEFD